MVVSVVSKASIFLNGDACNLIEISLKCTLKDSIDEISILVEALGLCLLDKILPQPMLDKIYGGSLGQNELK